MIKKLLNIDRRIIFIVIFVAVALAMLTKIPLPIRPSPNVRSVHEYIETLKDRPNATVLVSFDYGPGSAPELQPTAVNVIRQCFMNDIEVVGMCLWPDAVGLAEAAFDSMARAYGKQMGKDYVFLGFKPGFQTLILNMGENFKSAFARDYVGNLTSEMGATRRISKLEDFDYVITLAAGQTMDLVWVAYAVDRYNVTLGGACTAVMAPDMFPYLQSGQMNGLISGLMGAAEYETLNEAPGSAADGMRAQVAAHLVIIIFILIGNTMYFIQRRRQRD